MKTDDDATLEQAVERRIAAGTTPEMVAAQRRRYLVLHSLLLLSILISLFADLGIRTGSRSRTVLWALAVVILAALMVRGYRRLVPHAGRIVPEAELAELASRSHRCGRCHGVILPDESECPQCGMLTHPRWTLAFGIAFGTGMTALALWRGGYWK